LKTRFWK